MAIVRNPKYKPVYLTDKRYILLTGGRGSGKSFEISTFLCLLSYELNQRILFSRYTMTSAEISIIPEFKEKINLLEVPQHFKINSTDITNTQTNSDIIFRGIKTSSGNQTANLKSINGVSCFVCDEAEEFVNEEDFDTIDLSIRTRQAQNRVIILMNPSNKDHWVYKRWFVNNSELININGVNIELSKHPDVLHIHTTYLDNLNNLDKSFINKIEALRLNSPRTYAHKALGQWLDISEGSLFNKQTLKYFKYSETLEKSFESSLAYIDVADEGTDYTCMVIGRTIGNKIYIVDVVFSDANTDVTIPMCAAIIDKHKVSYCRVETNNMGAMFGRNLEKLLNNCQVLFANSSSNKHTRILMDSVFISESMYFLEESERSQVYENYLNQMALYTKDGKAKHDDAPDATSGLAIFIRSMLNDIF